MTTPDFSAFVRSESALFAAALADLQPAAPVPACPDWTAADLLWHLGEVQWFWSTVVTGRPSGPDGYTEPPRPDGHGELLQFFDTATRRLGDALDAADDAEPCWTWFAADQSVAFVRRRQAHEALIHRVDAEQAAGPRLRRWTPGSRPTASAEVFDWMFSSAPGWAEHRADGPAGVVTATDTGRRWLVQVGHWSGTSPASGRAYSRPPDAAGWSIPARRRSARSARRTSWTSGSGTAAPAASCSTGTPASSRRWCTEACSRACGRACRSATGR